MRAIVVLACVALAASPGRGQPESGSGGTVLERAAAYVETYLSAARTILAREQVTLQPLDANLRPDGRSRRLVYDTRLDWDPARERAGGAVVQRELVSVDGRPPRPGEDAGCLDTSAPEPLAFLLPAARGDYRFAPPVATSRGGRASWQVAFTPAAAGIPSLEWTGDCGRLVLPGHLRGTVTIEAGTFAVTRVDQRLVRPVDIDVPRALRRPDWGARITAERVDGSVVFAAVQFRDPDETVLMPSEIRHLTIVRVPGTRRLSVVQRWSNYRRFVTDGRMVPAPQ